MMAKKRKAVKHRTVVDKKGPGNIADEPAMKELKELLKTMSPEERKRTIDYLDGTEEGDTPDGK